jgi:hypothetical protein
VLGVLKRLGEVVNSTKLWNGKRRFQVRAIAPDWLYQIRVSYPGYNPVLTLRTTLREGFAYICVAAISIASSCLLTINIITQISITLTDIGISLEIIPQPITTLS